MRKTLVLLLGAASALLIACSGGGDSAPAGEPAPATGDTVASADDRGSATGDAALPAARDAEAASTPVSVKAAANDSCEMKVTGDLSETGTGKGGPRAVGSDYWLTDDDLRDALTAFEKVGTPGAPDAEVKRRVDAGMQNDPRLYTLIVNCETPGGAMSLSFLPGDDSRYADVPFGPKTYRIAAGGAVGYSAAGEFGAVFNVGERFFNVSEVGELKITKFDSSGIAGTFSFTAREPEFMAEGAPKTVTVTGSFSYTCTTGGRCKS